ncbi:PepSY-associated TM helix domain-containing protein [Paraburkholderia phenoliruptrix]|uniref:PepSY-associated TM helix domain-containing protein n=1 Tax=Paraburkholderia phenoliruptrix TaxID=252970 RepID=UPI001CB78935|nr:PepSY-associated TM helix domain-containing protein [Paraburkholderia phenoliruptrix]
MSTEAAPLPSRDARLLARRRAWLTAHRWFALTFGWVLALIGLTGALLVVSAPVDERIQSAQTRVTAPAAAADATRRVPLETIRERLSREFGAKTTLSFLPPHSPDRALAVNLRGKSFRGVVYLDPYTGRELARQSANGGFVATLFWLHSTLALDEAGKPVLAFVASIYLLLLVSGAVLWWPRRGMPMRWRIELGRGRTRALLDLHRTIGAVMGVLIAVSAATGAYMAWRPLNGFVTALAGGTPVRAPDVPPASALSTHRAPLDDLMARAQARFPDGDVYLVQAPPLAEANRRPVRVRLHVPDDPHPNGLTSVWLDPSTGRILAAQRWNALDLGARIVAVIYPLHTGELGGPLLQTLIAVDGVALFALPVSGVWLWWRRKRALRDAHDTRRAAPRAR